MPVRSALALLGCLLVVGCDAEDPEEALFEGTWRFAEVAISTDGDDDLVDVTSLVLAPYNDLLITFLEGDDRFTLVGDIEGTQEDLRLHGAYSATSDELQLTFDTSSQPILAAYAFTGERAVDLVAEDVDAEAWEALFGLNFGDLETMRIVLSR